MKIKGFDKLQRQLNKMAEAAEKLDGEHQLTLDEMFHPLFMLENTSFGSITEFFEASPFTVKSQADFEAIDEEALDSYVREKTRFQSWKEMMQTAGQEWMAQKFNEEIK